MALLKVKEKSTMTPEEIRNKLFHFHQAAHLYHQETMSGWEHDALGKLYEELADFKDDIPEKIMGYMDGKRIGKFKALDVPEYTSKESSIKLSKEIIIFAKALQDWAEEKEYCDIANIAQSLSGLAAKTLYRLTLK